MEAGLSPCTGVPGQAWARLECHVLSSLMNLCTLLGHFICPGEDNWSAQRGSLFPTPSKPSVCLLWPYGEASQEIQGMGIGIRELGS